MVVDTALATFDYLKHFIPQADELEIPLVEMVINAGSRYIADSVLGRPVVKKSYLEIHDYTSTIRVKKDHVLSVTSVVYDPNRLFTDGEDLEYWWEKPSRNICFLSSYIPYYARKTVEVQYVAGRYRLDHYGDDEPLVPLDGMVWHKAHENEFLVYDGAENEWTAVDQDDVVSQACVEALVEAVMYNKQRILAQLVGHRSKTGGQVSNYSTQNMEIKMPENIREIVTGEVKLL